MASKPDALIRLVQDEIESFGQARERYPNLFPQDVNLYPVPFFGDIRSAEVLTVALNPAWPEFKSERNWPAGLGARGLADRLVDYFDLWEVEPHPWFERCQPALSLLGRSYQRGAAHIDLLSHPTKFLNQLGGPDWAAFADLVGNSTKHLKNVLGLCPLVKLVIVIDFQFPVPAGGTATTFDFLANQFPPFTQVLAGGGDLPPIFRGGGVPDLPQRVRQHRPALRDCLQHGRLLEF